MKLLRVIASINPVLGGSTEAARLLDRALKAQGHEVTLLTLDSPDAHYLAEYPAMIQALGPSFGFYGYNTKVIKWLRANAHNYDAVVVDGLWQYPTLAVWLALSKSKATPYYVFVHGMLDPWFKLFYPKKHFKKLIYWRFFEAKVLRDARGVFFTCEEEKRLAPESFTPYSCTPIISPLGTERPPAKDEQALNQFFKVYPETQNKRLVLFLGRIHEKKGCDILIESFASIAAQYPNVHLVMAGPDQAGWVNALQNLSEQRGIADKITWTGMLSGDMKWAAFHGSEVFILPSHQENFGIAVVEALGCSKPVLISNKVNIWREIQADNAGWAESDDLEGCAQLLEQWLRCSPEQMLEKNQAALACFERRFQIESAARNFVDKISQHNKLD
ncbi:MAG: glycosyltransferase [Pseudomonadales bacterium]|nr:glycosyltransferase [Pseudomonadales bacterium]